MECSEDDSSNIRKKLQILLEEERKRKRLNSSGLTPLIKWKEQEGGSLNYKPTRQKLNQPASFLAKQSNQVTGTLATLQLYKIVFARRNNPENHKSLSEVRSQHKCRICQKIFNKPSCFYQHMMTHLLKCPSCQAVFSSRKLIGQHLRTCTSITPAPSRDHDYVTLPVSS